MINTARIRPIVQPNHSRIQQDHSDPGRFIHSLAGDLFVPALSTQVRDNKKCGGGPAYAPQLLDPHTLNRASDESERLLMRYIPTFGVGCVQRHTTIPAHHIFTKHTLDAGTSVIQKESGRCWIAATFNVLRVVAKAKGKAECVYSMNFVSYWHKLELANFFLEKLIGLADHDPSSREVQAIFTDVYTEGGNWETLFGLVEKYGIVPDYAMPATHFGDRSFGYNDTLEKLLREQGGQLHKAIRSNESLQVVQQKKRVILDAVRGILDRYLGVPPKSFVWKDEVTSEFTRMTPLAFAKMRDLCTGDQALFVSHMPNKPLDARLTYPDEEQSVGAPEVSSLNISLNEIKSAIRRSIVDGVPVCFSASMVEFESNSLNTLMLDPTLKKELLGIKDLPRASKADRLTYNVAAPEHGMIFTGCDDDPAMVECCPAQNVDGTWNINKTTCQSAEGAWTTLEDQKRLAFESTLSSNEAPIYGPKWKVQNSWEDSTDLYITDEWFDEYVYTAYIYPKYLSKHVLDMAADPFIPKYRFTPHSSL